jgi:uncharacterized protein YdeI (YjbR/CyaY-like superfamily)
MIYLPDRPSFRAWLAANHATHAPIWLAFDRKSAGNPRALTYDVIVEEALCFGWIDSLPGKVSETRTRLYLAPRKPGSIWSALNKRRVAMLQKQGLIAPPGAEKIARAKRDGSWDALNAVADVDKGVLPTDFEAALSKSKAAEKHFKAFPPGVRRQTVQWIITAKRAETRAERVRVSVAMCVRNLRPSDPAARKAFLAGRGDERES